MIFTANTSINLQTLPVGLFAPQGVRRPKRYRYGRVDRGRIISA